MAIEYLIPGRLARGNAQFLQSDGSVRLQKGVFGSSVQKETQKSHRLCISASTMASCWSGRRGSNSLPPPWQGGALPDELRPHTDNVFCVIGAPAKICEAKVCGEKEKIWYSSQKSCLQDFPMNDRIFDVVPPIGIEPMTRGFSVPCSTD